MAHVAIVTLAFAEIVRLVLSNLTELTRGEMGLWGIPPFSAIPLPFFGLTQFGPANKVSMYYVVFIACVAVHLVILGMVRSRIGLALVAMREAPDAAQSLGVNLMKNKLLVFGVSALLVGLMGGFYAHYIAILTPTAVAGPEIFILVFAMVLVGGIGTFTGPIIGALLLTLGVELLRTLGDYRLMIYGALVVLIMHFMPKGLASVGRLFDRRRPDGGEEQPAANAPGPIEGATNEV
jgi:branched-chain amino acid transport system permease protein